MKNLVHPNDAKIIRHRFFYLMDTKKNIAAQLRLTVKQINGVLKPC